MSEYLFYRRREDIWKDVEYLNKLINVRIIRFPPNFFYRIIILLGAVLVNNEEAYLCVYTRNVCTASISKSFPFTIISFYTRNTFASLLFSPTRAKSTRHITNTNNQAHAS